MNKDLLRECRECGLKAYTSEDLLLFKFDKASKYQRRNKCIDCERLRHTRYDKANRESRKNNALIHYHSNSGELNHKRWVHNISYNYGITEDDYDGMFQEQEGQCKICLKHQDSFLKKLAVDHCHITGKVRGLLCMKCNTALGKFNDDVSLLENAIIYLKENK